MFLAVVLVSLVGVILLAYTAGLRRGTARIAARVFFCWRRHADRGLRGLENMPAGQCVVVANHASYLDGVVMAAALPPRFGFVIKREMNDVPAAGLLLRRIGSEFVERFNRHKGGDRRAARAAYRGERPLAGVLPRGHVHAARSGWANSTPAPSPSRHARPARWCPR